MANLRDIRVREPSSERRRSGNRSPRSARLSSVHLDPLSESPSKVDVTANEESGLSSCTSTRRPSLYTDQRSQTQPDPGLNRSLGTDDIATQSGTFSATVRGRVQTARPDHPMVHQWAFAMHRETKMKIRRLERVMHDSFVESARHLQEMNDDALDPRFSVSRKSAAYQLWLLDSRRK